jgi:hypothetical protein
MLHVWVAYADPHSAWPERVATLNLPFEYLQVEYHKPKKRARMPRSSIFWHLYLIGEILLLSALKCHGKRLNLFRPGTHGFAQCLAWKWGGWLACPCRALRSGILQIFILKKVPESGDLRNLALVWIWDIPLLRLWSGNTKWHNFPRRHCEDLCVNTWTKKVETLRMPLQNT